MEGGPKNEVVTRLEDFRALKESSLSTVEAELEKLSLPSTINSIEEAEDSVLDALIGHVDAEEAKVQAVLEDSGSSAEEKRIANGERYRLRHLGYLREAAKRRRSFNELKVAA